MRAPGVDVVIITTPSGAHLRAGRRGRSRGQARRRREAAGDHPAAVRPDHRRLRPAQRQALHHLPVAGSPTPTWRSRHAVDAGRFGRLTLGETTCKWWRTQAYYDEGGWKGTQALDGGGALMNQAIHNVDLLLWMMGDGGRRSAASPPRSPTSGSRSKTRPSPSSGSRTGPSACIQATTSVHPGYPKTIAVHGDRGSAVIEQEDVLRWDFTPETPEDEAIKQRFAAKVGASGGAADPKAISHEGHRRQLADFVAAIREDRPRGSTAARGGRRWT